MRLRLQLFLRSASVRDINFDIINPNDERIDPVVPRMDLNFNNYELKNMNNTSNGGGITLTSANWVIPYLNFDNYSFKNMLGSYGGGAYIQGARGMFINNSRFNNCTATNHGGSLFISSINENLFLTNTSFINGKAGGIGGSFYLSNIYGELFIINCQFMNMISINGGGSIYLDSGAISKNMFQEIICINCSSSSNGGFAYMGLSHVYSNISILKVCMMECFTSSNGKGFFCSLPTNSVSNSSIIISYLSCIKSSPTKAGIGVIYSNNGNQLYENNNFTNNMGYYNNIYRLSPKNGLVITYNNFFNNTVSAYTAVYVDTINVATYLKYSIFSRNDSPSSYGVVHVVASSGSNILNIQYSIFFSNLNYLFSASSYGKLYVLSSHIIHNTHLYSLQFTEGAQCSIQTNDVIVAVEPTSTYQLSHFSTYLCQTLENILGLEITPCQTQPVPPTDCIFETNSGSSGSISLTQLFHIIYVTLAVFSYSLQ